MVFITSGCSRIGTESSNPLRSGEQSRIPDVVVASSEPETRAVTSIECRDQLAAPVACRGGPREREKLRLEGRP